MCLAAVPLPTPFSNVFIAAFPTSMSTWGPFLACLWKFRTVFKDEEVSQMYWASLGVGVD